MQPFQFIYAHDQPAAIKETGSGSRSKFIGGGTNLLDLMKLGVESPARLIDINSLDMDRIQPLSDGSVRIGALVRNSDLAYDPIISKRFPLLSAALLSGASPQLRNMATVGGNLMQRVRCPYFYDTVFPCNKRQPGSGCSAIEGYNRTHAILGTSDKCIATHPSDMCVALTALDAVIHVAGPAGDRSIPIADFHLLPGNTPERETALNNGELITSITIPDLSFAPDSHYLKVRDRASYEFALASAAVALDVRNGKIIDARIAMGGIGTKPWRMHAAEEILKGGSNTEATYKAAAEVALRGARTYKDNVFKVELAKRTLVSALITTGGAA
jgi:xanthine dehydrogenase YagS FAD-binding subunit